MNSWLALAAQAILAAASLHVVRWHVLPGLVRARQPQVIVDVWLPVAMALPFVLGALLLDANVAGFGWSPMIGPIAIALLSTGLAMLAAGGRFDPFGEHTLLHEDDSPPLWPLRARLLGTAVLAGVVLLMLGAAYTLTVWIGQAAFALAAIVLWINTPELAASKESRSSADERLGWATMGVVMLSAGLGAAALWVEGAHHAVSTAILLFHAAAIAGMAAFIVGPGIAARLGLWAAGIGVLASLGVLSLSTVLPRAVEAMRADYFEPQPAEIAYGFGAFAFEATALILLAPAMLALARMERRAQHIVAGIVLWAALLLIAWRLSAMM